MIIVVGAGISGLACAAALRRGGEEVIVVEGRDRIGGRIWTDHALGVPVDLGASWIHGHRHNPVMQLARRYRIPVIESDYTALAAYDGSGRLPNAVADELGELYEWLYEWAEKLCYKHPKHQPDLSVASAMAFAMQRGTRIETRDPRALDWTLCSIAMSEGIDLGQVSLRYFEDDDPFEGEDYLFQNGYEELLERLADQLDIRLSHVVEAIEVRDEVEGGKRCRVLTDRGALEADEVVVTLPLGVLKRGEVRFSPELPEGKQRAIDELGMGCLDKIAVRFEARFWPKEAQVIGKLSAPFRHLAWALDLERVTGAPILVGFMGGEDAVEAEALSDEALLERFLQDLESCFGEKVRRVEAFKVTRWMADPFARGAYSHIPVGASGLFYDALAAPVDEALYFAGEATCRDQPATAHGALMSGERAAEEILRWKRRGA